MDYNRYRPHISPGYVTPAGFVELSRQAGCFWPRAIYDGYNYQQETDHE